MSQQDEVLLEQHSHESEKDVVHSCGDDPTDHSVVEGIRDYAWKHESSLDGACHDGQSFIRYVSTDLSLSSSSSSSSDDEAEQKQEDNDDCDVPQTSVRPCHLESDCAATLDLLYASMETPTRTNTVGGDDARRNESWGSTITAAEFPVPIVHGLWPVRARSEKVLPRVDD